MDSQEYKRQNAQRDAQRKAKLFEETLAENIKFEAEAKKLLDTSFKKTWEYKLRFFKWRPGWWTPPADRFAGLVAIFTLCLVVVSYCQLNAIRGQLTAMEADQRPWIKANVEIGGPLQFPPNGIGILPLKITLTNAGKSPALNIRPAIWAFIPSRTRKDMHAEWQHRCENLRAEPLDNPARGFVLFPGDHSTLEEAGLGPISAIAVTSDEIRSAPIDEDGKKILNISIYGCFDYLAPSRELHHQTGVASQVMRVIKRKRLPVMFTSSIHPIGTIEAGSLRLWPSPSSSGQIN
jgi:hypothetical protein